MSTEYARPCRSAGRRRARRTSREGERGREGERERGRESGRGARGESGAELHCLLYLLLRTRDTPTLRVKLYETSHAEIIVFAF